MVRDGYFYGLSLLVVAVLLQAVTHSWAWAIMPLALALFFLWFFRDPQRAIPQGEGLVVSPADGLVTSVDQFLNAMDVTSAEKNEQNIVTLASDDGYEVVFKQIAGLLARRIVFHFKAGDRVRRGQRVGLIKFGSRTDIELPGHAEVRVRKGERVKGGASVIAQLARREAPTEPAAELVGSLV